MSSDARDAAEDTLTTNWLESKKNAFVSHYLIAATAVGNERCPRRETMTI
jgi:hypothetical protein